jgi:chromosome segregation ATPase
MKIFSFLWDKRVRKLQDQIFSLMKIINESESKLESEKNRIKEIVNDYESELFRLKKEVRSLREKLLPGDYFKNTMLSDVKKLNKSCAELFKDMKEFHDNIAKL